MRGVAEGGGARSEPFACHLSVEDEWRDPTCDSVMSVTTSSRLEASTGLARRMEGSLSGTQRRTPGLTSRFTLKCRKVAMELSRYGSTASRYSTTVDRALNDVANGRNAKLPNANVVVEDTILSADSVNTKQPFFFCCHVISGSYGRLSPRTGAY